MALVGRFSQPVSSFLVVLALKPIVAHGGDMACLGGFFQPSPFFFGIAALKGVTVMRGPDVASLRSQACNYLHLIHNLLHAVELSNRLLGQLFLKESRNLPTQEENSRFVALAGYALQA